MYAPTIKWVLLHVGIVGNEQADRGAAQGAKRSLQHLQEHRSVPTLLFYVYQNQNMSLGPHASGRYT